MSYDSFHPRALNNILAPSIQYSREVGNVLNQYLAAEQQHVVL